MANQNVAQYTEPGKHQSQNKNGITVERLCSKDCKKSNCPYRHDIEPTTVWRSPVAHTNPGQTSPGNTNPGHTNPGLEASEGTADENTIGEFSTSTTPSDTKSGSVYVADIESVEARKSQAKKRDESKKRLRVVCLIIALIVHSLLEGLAVGLQTTTAGLVSIILLIGFHKSIIGFSLGVNIATSKADLRGHLKNAVSVIDFFLFFIIGHESIYMSPSPKKEKVLF